MRSEGYAYTIEVIRREVQTDALGYGESDKYLTLCLSCWEAVETVIDRLNIDEFTAFAKKFAEFWEIQAKKMLREAGRWKDQPQSSASLSECSESPLCESSDERILPKGDEQGAGDAS